MLALLGKIGFAVGTALLVEHGDEVVDGIIGLFGGDGDKSKPAKEARSPDRQLVARETMTQFGAKGMPKLSAEQARSAASIARVCNVLHIFEPEKRRAICMALWVNAWHESRLRPGAHNPKGEDSRGLFQINVRAHPQWKNKRLYDAHVNTACILVLALKQRPFLEAVESGSLAQLVYAVCRYVERPKNAHEAALRRVETARRWYGANL